jgi:hypothetical protein
VIEETHPFSANLIADRSFHALAVTSLVACISEIDTTCVAMFSVRAVYDRPFPLNHGKCAVTDRAYRNPMVSISRSASRKHLMN